MSFLTPVLYYGIILPLSWLPMRVLHMLSDVLFFVVYWCVPYRKHVVLKNLRQSFPEKSDLEIHNLSKEFYRHFCDLIVESLKSFSISEKEASKRMARIRSEVMERYHSEGKSVIIAGGHYNNWEWFGVAVAQQIPHDTIAIFKPLSNKFFDKKIRESRSRYGLRMAPISEVTEIFKKGAQSPFATIFGVDQSPGSPSKAHWIRFLNQDTPVPFGAEKLSKEYDLPVVYGVIKKLKRGYYQFEFQDITSSPRTYGHGKLMEEISRRIEKDILEQPAYWLWSHRRWKHQRPADALSAANHPSISV